MFQSVRVTGVCFWFLFLVGGVSANPTDEAKLQRGEILFEPCEMRGLDGNALCGWYEVYENRETREGRKIKLKVVVVPATNENPKPDPVFFFAGGPGQGAAEIAGFMAQGHSMFRPDRDLVFIDQRGTGESNPLSCPVLGPTDKLQTYLGDMFEAEYVKNCRTELEKKADLTLYTTSIAMDDIDEVRAALGYEKINLKGGSYGTRAAMEYLRRHPDTVRTAILGGIAPPFQAIPADFAKDTERALQRLIKDCGEDEVCSQAFPNFAENLAKVCAQLKKEPVTLEVSNPFTNQKETVTLAYGPFSTGLRSLLYNVQGSARIPLMIKMAANGDWESMAVYTAFYQKNIGEGVADGMYLTITCAEDIPLIDVAKAIESSRGTMLGPYRVQVQVDACKLWPKGKIPAGYNDPVKTDLPILILSGDVDPVTPPYWAEAAAKHMPNSLHVVTPNAAHGMLGAWDCLQPLMTEFLEKASTASLDASCVAKTKRPPVITDPAKLFQGN